MQASVPLIGREPLLEEVRALWRSGERLLTLVGPPGVGKSRVAATLMEQASSWLDVSSRTAAFVDLRGLEETLGLVSAIASAVSLPGEMRSGGILESVCDWLSAGGDTLLVLDNCEQAVEPVRQIVETLRQRAPNVGLLLTSRRAIEASGETCVQVGPLSVEGSPDGGCGSAVELFAAFAGQKIGEESLEQVLSIVRRLEGLPLSLALAAGRLDTLSLAELDARLNERFRLLKDALSYGDTHSTLWSTVDWSWRLLSEEQQNVLGQLSVFEAALPLSVAEEFVELEGSSADQLAQGSLAEVLRTLVAHNLLFEREDPAGDVVFDMLETIREFVRLRWEPSEPSTLVARYRQVLCDTGLRLARESVGQNGHLNLQRLQRFRTDLLQVLEADEDEVGLWSALRIKAGYALSTLLFWLGERETQDQILEQVPSLFEASGKLQPDNTLQPDVRALLFKLETMRANLYRRTGRHDDARDLAQRCLNDAEERGDREERVLALVPLAQLNLHHDLDRAVALGRQGLQLTDEHGELASQRASLLQVLAIAEMDRGNQETSEAHLQAGLAAADSIGDELLRGSLLALCANLELDRDAPDEAMEFLTEAESIFERYGEYRRTTVIRGLQAICRFTVGKPALDEFLEVVERFRRVGDRLFEAFYRMQAAEAYLVGRRWSEARAELEASLRIRRELEARTHSVATLALLAALDATEGRHDEARGLLDEAVEIQKESGTTYGELTLASCRAIVACLETPMAKEFRQAANKSMEKMISRGSERALRRLLEHGLTDEETLEVKDSGARFRRSGEEWVSLATREAPRRIFNALVVDHLGPREGLDKDALLSAGWPDESVVEKAAVNRVYVAIATLRKLGLDGLIDNEDGRYRLLPGLVVKSSDR